MHPSTTLATTSSTRRRLAAAAMAVAFAAASLAIASPALATTRGDGLRAAANKWRTCENESKIDCVPVAPIGGSSLLDSISDARADQMRDADKMEHDMDYVRYRLNKAGACWTSFGEIIAWRSGGTYSYDGTALQWWNSDPHREIMTGAGFNAAGGSWATADDGGHFSVMIYATLCGGSSETTAVPLLKLSQAYSPDRPMVFTKGTHTGYKFSSTGEVLGKKTVTFSRRVGADAAGRTKINGRAWIKVGSGSLAGYWVKESDRQFVRGFTEKDIYSAMQRVKIAPGVYTGYRFDRFGHVMNTKPAKQFWNTREDVSAWAVINGRPYYLVQSGKWDNWWLPDTRDVDPV